MFGACGGIGSMISYIVADVAVELAAPWCYVLLLGVIVVLSSCARLMTVDGSRWPSLIFATLVVYVGLDTFAKSRFESLIPERAYVFPVFVLLSSIVVIAISTLIPVKPCFDMSEEKSVV